MEQIQTQLVNLGFNKDVSEKDYGDGPPNLAFVEVVTWLSSQLIALYELESHVSLITDADDILGFLVEVSSFLKELSCPYKALMKGQIPDRLVQSDDKKLLITYLCTELEAAKILALKKPKKKEAPMQIELEESKTARELREMLICLKFPKPPETITPQQLFGEVEKKLKGLSQPSTPKEKIGDLLFSGCLTEKQWFQLEYLYKEMYQEYKTRRNLLLTRLDVTVKSFLWADRLKVKADAVIHMYNARKTGIGLEPSVKISHILAAKADLAIVEKTSSGSVRKNTKSSVNSVIIGAVPDRGGRPEEQQPPPPEVPSWQKNDSSSRGGMKQSNPPSGNYKNTNYSRDENANQRSYDNNYKSDNSSRGNYKGGRNDYNSGRNDYNAGRNDYNAGRNDYNSGRGDYNSGRSDYNTGRSDYNAGRNDYSSGRNDYNAGRNDYNAGRNDYSAGRNDYSAGRNDYSAGRNDYNAAPPPMYQPVNYCAQLGNPQFGFGGYMPAGDNFQQYGISDGMNQFQPRAATPHGSGPRPRGGFSDRGSNQSRGRSRGRGRYQ